MKEEERLIESQITILILIIIITICGSLPRQSFYSNNNKMGSKKLLSYYQHI